MILPRVAPTRLDPIFGMWLSVQLPPRRIYLLGGMKARAAEKWTYENLDAFIKDPKTSTPKTKMVFAGVKKDQARADIIAYLASLSDAPKPFPAP